MKRSLSAPCLVEENNESKKIKSDINQMGPNTREYLQLALAKVLELQRQVREDTYISDNTSDLGDSENEEDLMKEVVIKVFKDLPGPSRFSSIIENVMKPRHPGLDAIRHKSIQLSGYDTCRKVAVNFMRNIVKYTPKVAINSSQFRSGTFSRADVRTASYRTGLIENGINCLESTNRRRETLSSDYEIRTRMLKSLDLHLAIKQRDYTARLMRN